MLIVHTQIVDVEIMLILGCTASFCLSICSQIAIPGHLSAISDTTGHLVRDKQLSHKDASTTNQLDESEMYTVYLKEKHWSKMK